MKKTIKTVKPIKNIIIFLKKENVTLMPYISNGQCTSCYFWPDKTGKMNYEELNKAHNNNFHCPLNKNVPSCSGYRVNGDDVNVIFKEVTK